MHAYSNSYDIFIKALARVRAISPSSCTSFDKTSRGPLGSIKSHDSLKRRNDSRNEMLSRRHAVSLTTENVVFACCSVANSAFKYLIKSIKIERRTRRQNINLSAKRNGQNRARKFLSLSLFLPSFVLFRFASIPFVLFSFDDKRTRSIRR